MKNSKERIELSDSMMDVMMKLGEGNPGALSVCIDIHKHTPQIDPDSAMGGLGVLLSLDTHQIYGPRIWMLYKDVCGEDLPTMLAVLRACQLGYIPPDTLDYAIDNRGKGIDIKDIVAKVTAELPAFQM